MPFEIDPKKLILALTVAGSTTACGPIFLSDAVKEAATKTAQTATAVSGSRAATETARPVLTSTPSPTEIPTPTATITLKPTIVITSTPSQTSTRTPSSDATSTPRPSTNEGQAEVRTVEVTRIVYVDRAPSQSQSPLQQSRPNPEPAPVPYVAPEPAATQAEPVAQTAPVVTTDIPAEDIPSESVDQPNSCLLSENSDGSSINLSLRNDGTYNEMVAFKADNPDDTSRKDITDSPQATNMNQLIRDADGSQANITLGLWDVVLDDTYTGRYVGPTGITLRVCEAPTSTPESTSTPLPAPKDTATPLPDKPTYPQPTIVVHKMTLVNGQYKLTDQDWAKEGDKCEVNMRSAYVWNRWVNDNLTFLKTTTDLQYKNFKNFDSGDMAMLATALSMTYDDHMATDMEPQAVLPLLEKLYDLKIKCTQVTGFTQNVYTIW